MGKQCISLHIRTIDSTNANWEIVPQLSHMYLDAVLEEAFMRANIQGVYRELLESFSLEYEAYRNPDAPQSEVILMWLWPDFRQEPYFSHAFDMMYHAFTTNAESMLAEHGFELCMPKSERTARVLECASYPGGFVLDMDSVYANSNLNQCPCPVCANSQRARELWRVARLASKSQPGQL